ncbi:MAG: putative CXXCH cytochrome family protein [Bacteroidia bacterium]|jgi:predicted CXXCH cytochrome family protein
MNRRKSIWVFGTLVGAIVFLTQFCSPAEKIDTAVYLNHSDSAKYVGMNACAQCHLDKVETFSHTGMGLSFDTVSQQKSSANLHTKHVLYDSINNFYYYPYWRNDKLFVKEFRLSNGDTTFQRTEEISYIIGSGQHTNSHLIKKGDYVIQAPFTWYAQNATLDFPPGFENGANSRFSRVIDQECMSCHNGLPVMESNTTKAFSYVPNGIDCERCHGPGSIHISNRLSGIGPDNGVDYSIVNPSNLSWQRQIDVCQRCHLQGNNVLKPGKTFNDFKPGMVLSDFFEIYLPQYTGGDQLFNMANHSDRFQNSQCFIQSNQKGTTLTCITCHDPHVSVVKTASSVFNQKCESCHKSASTTCTELLKVRTIEGDNCVGCHMPKSGTEDIPHVTVHDHKIGIYSDVAKSTDKEVIGLYCVNNPNPDNITLIKAYLTYYEKFEALPIYQQHAEELLKKVNDSELQIHLYYQKQQWRNIIGLVDMIELPDDFAGHTCYRVGKAWAESNSVEYAVNWLELAVLKEPGEFAFKSELGSQLIKLKRYESAELVLLKAMKQYDNYVPTYNNLGYLYLLTGEYSKAKSILIKSLQLDPDNMLGKENLVLLYTQLKDEKNENIWLQSILKQNPYHDAAMRRYSQLNETK